jgi:hypothetical protein
MGKLAAVVSGDLGAVMQELAATSKPGPPVPSVSRP